MPCRATQDRRVMVESSDKMWSAGEGNGKPLKQSCLENPMNSMKKQKKKILFQMGHNFLTSQSLTLRLKKKKSFKLAFIMIQLNNLLQLTLNNMGIRGTDSPCG